MTKPINILLLDDKKDYREGFKTRAQQQRILVDAVDNLESLLELLEENRKKYQFVVLDARAFAKEGQHEGSEHESQLFKAFREIKRIEQKYCRYIPFCVNTGFADLKLQYNEEIIGCKVFEKGKEDDLLKYIIEMYNNTDEAKIKSAKPEIFDFTDKYFDDVNNNILLALLKNNSFQANDIAVRVSNLASLRRICEHLADILFDKHLGSPSGLINSKSSRTFDVFSHYKSSGNLPTQVNGAVLNLLTTTSNYGSHNPQQATKLTDYPSSDSITGLTYGLFEAIRWAQKQLP
jgi:hypothetical protein